MTAMSYVPYITWNVVPHCSSHFYLQNLKGPFYMQKEHSKVLFGIKIYNIQYNVNQLAWYDPQSPVDQSQSWIEAERLILTSARTKTVFFANLCVR